MSSLADDGLLHKAQAEVDKRNIANTDDANIIVSENANCNTFMSPKKIGSVAHTAGLETVATGAGLNKQSAAPCRAAHRTARARPARFPALPCAGRSFAACAG